MAEMSPLPAKFAEVGGEMNAQELKELRIRYEQRIFVYGDPDPESPLGDTEAILAEFDRLDALIRVIRSLLDTYGKGLTTAPLTILAIQNLLRDKT